MLRENSLVKILIIIKSLKGGCMRLFMEKDLAFRKYKKRLKNFLIE